MLGLVATRSAGHGDGGYWSTLKSGKLSKFPDSKICPIEAVGIISNTITTANNNLITTSPKTCRPLFAAKFKTNNQESNNAA